jgi:hypothetical protein
MFNIPLRIKLSLRSNGRRLNFILGGMDVLPAAPKFQLITERLAVVEGKI